MSDLTTLMSRVKGRARTLERGGAKTGKGPIGEAAGVGVADLQTATFGEAGLHLRGHGIAQALFPGRGHQSHDTARQQRHAKQIGADHRRQSHRCGDRYADLSPRLLPLLVMQHRQRRHDAGDVLTPLDDDSRSGRLTSRTQAQFLLASVDGKQFAGGPAADLDIVGGVADHQRAGIPKGFIIEPHSQHIGHQPIMEARGNRHQ